VEARETTEVDIGKGAIVYPIERLAEAVDISLWTAASSVQVAAGYTSVSMK
jgi:hypothetical protein